MGGFTPNTSNLLDLVQIESLFDASSRFKIDYKPPSHPSHM